MMRAVAAVTLAAVLCCALSLGQDEPRTGKLEVRVRGISGARSYNLKDSIELDIEIFNPGPEPIGVFAKLGMGYQGGIILHVLDSAGAEVQPRILAHDFLDVRAMKAPENYFELQPGQFFGTRQRFVVSDLVAKPGRYKLRAEYHCPVDAKYGKVRNFWSIERKSIVSKEFELTIQ